jgi:hypothetical protein
MASTGYTGGGPEIPGDSLDIASNGAGGMVLGTNTSISPGPPIHFWLGTLEAARLQIIPAATNGTVPWQGLFNLQNNQTTNAGSTASTMIDMTANGNWNTTTVLNNNGTGAHAAETMYLGNDAGEYAAFQLTNTGFTDAATHNLAIFGTSASQGMWLSSVHNISIYGGTQTSILNYAGGGLGAFLSNGTDFVGLALPGYSAIFAGNSGLTGFSLGNAYLTGTNWAGMDISGAARFDGTNWHADGGAGAGVGLIHSYQGVHAFYYSGAL